MEAALIKPYVAPEASSGQSQSDSTDGNKDATAEALSKLGASARLGTPVDSTVARLDALRLEPYPWIASYEPALGSVKVWRPDMSPRWI